MRRQVTIELWGLVVLCVACVLADVTAILRLLGLQ